VALARALKTDVDTSISRLIRADPAIVFGLAAAVEDWPRILPHYRWVRVLASQPDGRRAVDMAARRDVCPGLAVPLRWTAIQTVDVRRHRIEFEHVRGITRGMRVAWTIEPADVAVVGQAALVVQIRHVFEPRWAVPDALVRLVVGEYFVNGVARRTLRRIGELAETRGGGHTA
jgi:ribosome-associated toxin RatA of RatAB toxin-antitoxin module